VNALHGSVTHVHVRARRTTACLASMVRNVTNVPIVASVAGAGMVRLVMASAPAFLASQVQHALIACRATPSATQAAKRIPTAPNVSALASLVERLQMQGHSPVITSMNVHVDPVANSNAGRVAPPVPTVSKAIAPVARLPRTYLLHPRLTALSALQAHSVPTVRRPRSLLPVA
jgi:hypothetical protein